MTTANYTHAQIMAALKQVYDGIDGKRAVGVQPAMLPHQIERNWQEGMPISTIASKTGMTIAQVRKFIKSKGHKIPG